VVVRNPFTTVRRAWEKELVDRLGYVGGRLKNILVTKQKEVFGGRGKRDGEGKLWRPTTPIALANRVNPVMNPKSTGWFTLVDTGRLEDSIEGKSKAKKKEGLRIRVGTKLGYAATHQFGGWFYPPDGGDRLKVDERKIFFWTNDDRTVSILEIMTELRRVS